MSFAKVIAVTAAAFLVQGAALTALYVQWGRAGMAEDRRSGREYPLPRSGLAQRGARLYRELGCYACHTRQTLALKDGPDLVRGWGRRRSVARDYLRDRPLLVGDLRIGPDLANVGLRQTNRTAFLLRLWRPGRGKSPMPAFRSLFATRLLRQGSPVSAWALPLHEDAARGLEVLPKREAEALAAYLLEQRADAELPETPGPGTPERESRLSEP
ncbi:MAG: cbb3-type cytochrome c oxidase subunit II [Verrucomicrobia bacterium]|nr:cbb3-type cytochrome c oxidase subunit II [Verrucomicrobiota bacterium]